MITAVIDPLPPGGNRVGAPLTVRTLRLPPIAHAAEGKPPPSYPGPPVGGTSRPGRRGPVDRLFKGLRLLAVVARRRELGSDTIWTPDTCPVVNVDRPSAVVDGSYRYSIPIFVPLVVHMAH